MTTYRRMSWGAALVAVIASAALVISWARQAALLPGLATAAGYDSVHAGDETWLASGRIPGLATPWSDMARTSLRDLHHLTPAPPLFAGPAAGAAQAWGLTWPRDASFSIVAMARTGHPVEALAGLSFLQEVQHPDGGFAARYQLDGQKPLDSRRDQLDGSGWVLWALDAVAGSADDEGRSAILRRFRPLLDRATNHILRQINPATGLPRPSSDYWERAEDELTLGTAAPLLAGLQAAARMDDDLRATAEGVAATTAATRLDSAIAAHFGPGGYQRYGRHGGVDASVCFLAPPFAHFSDSGGVAAAVRTYQVTARRTAGGLAPGAGWRSDGVSWTPETALVALDAAATGDRATAGRWLTWLDRQRVSWGSLPEKVRPDGAPAGPAPLAWTSALVVLTLGELSPERLRETPPLTLPAVSAYLERIDPMVSALREAAAPEHRMSARADARIPGVHVVSVGGALG